jgi:two-component system, OmpR family, response regulator
MTGRILVADDDDLLREFISQGLREAGYLVTEASTLVATLHLARSEDFDLLIFDRQMPDGDCADVLRTLRGEARATPALFLTAARAVEKRVEGLDAGADDYLTKPFSIVELAARVRALLRRPQAIRNKEVKCGMVTLHLDARRILVGDTELVATAHEWRLLALLIQRPGVVFSRTQIIAEVGIADDADDVAVDHLVSRLRQKLRQHGEDNVIVTVRGMGFAWQGN